METPWFGVILSVALFVFLIMLTACGKKPIVTVGAVAACGPLPPQVILCIQTLPADAPDADVARCYVNTVDQLIGENQQLRKQFTPCAK